MVRSNVWNSNNEDVALVGVYISKDQKSVAVVERSHVWESNHEDIGLVGVHILKSLMAEIILKKISTCSSSSPCLSPICQ